MKRSSVPHLGAKAPLTLVAMIVAGAALALNGTSLSTRMMGLLVQRAP